MTIAFLHVIPVAPNTVIVWEPCDERPPNPVDAFGSAKARKTVLRKAIDGAAGIAKVKCLGR